jgi:DNA-binding LacI/PurR family transcriptional regulator
MTGSHSISIHDVARRAGLSTTTVSRVLNKKGYFSDEAAQRVEEAVQELGYRPNWWARGLRGQPSKLVGLIIPDISNVFYTSVAASVLSVLRKNRYEMILCVNEESPEKDLGYLQILEERHADGILYIHPAGGSNSIFIHELAGRGMPMVEINRQSEKDLLDAVLADNLGAIQQSMRYLMALGHCRIALVSGEPFIITGAERVNGYRTALARAGLPVDPDLLKIGSFSRKFGEQATEELLALPQPPTAIFAGSNRICLGVLTALSRKNVCIPEDISVVAFDDAEWLGAWNPPITAVDIAVDEMARLAVDLLHRRITGAGVGAKPITYHLSTSLIVRKSCKKLVEGDDCLKYLLEEEGLQRQPTRVPELSRKLI